MRREVHALALGSACEATNPRAADWGCAKFDATGERHRACGIASSFAEQDRGKRVLRAERVPWLGVWPVMTAERWCARVGSELECWPALEFLRQWPAAIPDRRHRQVRVGRARRGRVDAAQAEAVLARVVRCT